MTKYFSTADFVALAEVSWAFLTDDGFGQPEVQGRRLVYRSDDLTVEALFDDRDGRIEMRVGGAVGERRPRAGLSCLYTTARIGPAQEIADIGRTERQLRLALESHATALRAVLPHLRGPRRDELLISCHGR